MTARIRWTESRFSDSCCPAKGDGTRYRKNCPAQREAATIANRIDELAPQAFAATFQALSRKQK